MFMREGFMAPTINELRKVAKTLDVALQLYKDSFSSDIEIQKAFRDACIQRFEYCIELSWKTSRRMLGSQTSAAKVAIREMARNGTIFIFGSRVTGKHHPFSDLDVLLREDLSYPLDTKFFSDLKEAIEESMITIKVDLVLENDLASSYRESVFRDMMKW